MKSWKLLIKTKINYEKSNDEKVFITSIKNLIGNALSDQALIELAKDDQKNFINKIKGIFWIKKRNESKS